MKQYFTKINLTKMNLFSFIKENAKICLKTDRRALSFYLFAVLMLFSLSKTYAQCYTVTKTLLGVTPASSGVQGNIDATYRIMIVQNPSCIITGNIVVTDAIGSATNLGTKFVKLVGLPIVVYSSPTVTVPTLNGAYDGTIANPDITINDGIMLGGDTLTYQLIAEINPRAAGAGTLGNTATVLNEIPPGPPPPVEAVSMLLYFLTAGRIVSWRVIMMYSFLSIVCVRQTYFLLWFLRENPLNVQLLAFMK
ncbi:MAG: hypothetical protein IPK61_11050 [Saprospiraceae bacterium]|nr:hypothetical protein [Saprospiraceae bacterium]